jgi:DNA-binding HxlR family transcriptional regulator
VIQVGCVDELRTRSAEPTASVDLGAIFSWQDPANLRAVVDADLNAASKTIADAMTPKWVDSPAQARSQVHSSPSPASSPAALQHMKLSLLKIKCTVASMKRYGQACAIARSLDVVGERWSLLLVRELTLGPRRYRDLATGLPGIPSNVLATRLKELQAAGVITRRTLPAPTDVTVYELTDAGRALQPALNELLDWGLRYGPEPSVDDVVQPGWGLLGGVGRPSALPDGQTCELRVGPEFFYLSSAEGKLTVRRGPAPDGDAVVTMSADTLYSLLTGHTSVTDAVRHSTVDGDKGIARRALEPLAAAFTKPAPAT